MEACVTDGAGKGDIRVVVNLFVLGKTRQSYELRAAPIVISAHKWQQDGEGPTDIPLFGPADLRIEWLGGNENDDEMHYRVNYSFWIPAQDVDESQLSVSSPRSDLLTLIRKKGNWRISEIKRE
jgi:hypothetical protein